MKNILKIQAVFLILAITACKRDSMDPVFTDNANVRHELLAELKPAPEVFHRPGSYFTKQIITSDGILINFPWVGLLDKNGNLYPDGYDIQVQSMLTMKNMFLNNVSTVGPRGLFKSGGELSIRAFESSGNTEIQYYPEFGMVGVSFPEKLKLTSINAGPSNYPIWYGNVNPTSGGVDWAPADPTVLVDTISGTPIGIKSEAYYWIGSDSLRQAFNLIQFGFVNLDVYYLSNEPKAKIVVQVPSGLTDKNTICGIAFPDLNSVATQFDFDPTKNQFILPTEIPVGLFAKVILISKSGGKYYSLIKPVTVEQFAVISAKPNETTIAAFKKALEWL